MTSAVSPLTPREYAERALVGVLLWQPGRVTDIAVWLDAEDFRTPANGAVFRHLREAVAEACLRVKWGTDAEDALRIVMGIADNLCDMRERQANWSDMDTEAELHAHADTVARYAAEYPGLLQRLDTRDRAEIDAVLPLASVNPYAVPGVDPVSLFERISNSGEPGDRFILAPFLHTLMATAPATSMSQPEVYGQMVLEAAIRRQVHESGMRVAQTVETTTELAGLLAAVETAVNHLDAAQHRWDAGPTDRSGINPVGQPFDGWMRVDSDTLKSRLDLVASMPEEQDILAAEETVLAAVLVRPDMLTGLVDRLYPEDFADQQLGAAFRAAVEVDTTARVTGRRVDPVTVAWEQQRHAARHGPGVPVERLLHLADRGPVGNVEYATEVVMRGRLARLTADAAQAVQQAAQHPGLQPADVLHTTRLAYDAVRATATRMAGEPIGQCPEAELDPRTPEPVDQPAGPPGRSSAQVIQLRQRAATLRTAVSDDRHTRLQTGRLAHPVRADHGQDAEQDTGRDLEPDL